MKTEPVAILDLVKYTVLILASYGVIVIPDGMLDSIVIVGAALISVVLTLVTRSKVTPATPVPPLDRPLT